MSDGVRAGQFRVCGYCGSRTKSGHVYCVRCSAPLDAAVTGYPGATGPTRPRNARLVRFVLAAGVLAALAVGLMVRSVFKTTIDAAAISDDVRADGARTVSAAPVAPPPAVTGWYPGANVPVEPDTAPSWSSGSFPAARMNPYDVPGDPNASMVGIAPSAPRVRAAMRQKRVFTEQDLLATRGSAWTTPAAGEVTERESKLTIAESRLESARTRLAQARAQLGRAADKDHVRDAIEQAEDDLEDAQEDAAKAQRKLQEARRDN